MLVFLPDRNAFFLRGDGADAVALADVVARGAKARVEIVGPAKRSRVGGAVLPLLDTVAALSVVKAAEVTALPASAGAWVLASKFALDLVSRERVIPALWRTSGTTSARWAAALSAPEDSARLKALAGSMPPAAHAVPAPGERGREVWAPEALLRAFLDSCADGFVREAATSLDPDRTRATSPQSPSPPRRKARRGSAEAMEPWENRWLRALTRADTDADATFEPTGFRERTLLDDLQEWSEPALGRTDRLRACFRLELPDSKEPLFVLRYLLQSPDDPSLIVTASDVWLAKGRNLSALGRAFRDPQESLLEALGRASRVFPPVASSLTKARPTGVAFDEDGAWDFISAGAPALAAAGFGVIVPAELTAAGRRRLRLRMRVSGGASVTGAVAGAAGLGMDELLTFEWQGALGDEPISAAELQALARHKSALVRHRGEWIAVDPAELSEIGRRMADGTGQMAVREAIVGALAGETRVAGRSVAVVATGAVANLIEQLRGASGKPLEAPPGFKGKMRPYQKRGLAWLATMGQLGLGSCLADDMGLGKTVQMLAFLLRRSQLQPTDSRPALLVAPTSVMGNWEREAERFTPDLRFVRHYGTDRVNEADLLPRAANVVVVTSYGLLRRDAELLSAVEWSSVILDEAQNIKNAGSVTAQAARSLRAAHRFALTGTPVENRLAELWSIYEFANPGMLGPISTFHREYAVPIERYGNDEAATQLRKVVSPFLLRRLKSDPAVIRDLPPKNEMKVFCSLTREQASLYQAVVDEEMRRIEEADGIERRGRVLALLMHLKQVCNHPAQYVGDASRLERRSGKLDRMTEMLEEAVAEGDKALVFTQFVEMGHRLVSHLSDKLAVEVAFLHGGSSVKAREDMVRRFQEDAQGPRIFVLSVKAGGTGLNLTAASHVFHFDRWWNPAVEDQATDRAYRIGQKRTVQVHKFVCAGTVEDKIDQMLEQKRDLASRIVAGGEIWITELDNASLRDLFALSADAAAASVEGEPTEPD